MHYKKEEIYFSTLSINNWIPVFHDFPGTISFLFDSLTFCTKELKVKIYAFVIMRDHIHLVWHMPIQIPVKMVATKLKQYAGTKIVNYLTDLDDEYLHFFNSERLDREHKVWNINESHFRIQHHDILIQKVRYIHFNPTKGDYKIVDEPEEYLFSSANAYIINKSNFPFLTILPNI